MQEVCCRWPKAYSSKHATIQTTTTTNHRYVVSQLTFLVSWPQNLNKPYLTFFYFERFHGLLRIQLLTSSAWDSKKHKNYHKMKESWLMIILNVKWFSTIPLSFLSYFDILLNRNIDYEHDKKLMVPRRSNIRNAEASGQNAIPTINNLFEIETKVLHWLQSLSSFFFWSIMKSMMNYVIVNSPAFYHLSTLTFDW